MNFTDEKDYIMRIIKEMVRVLFSLLFGRQYTSVELEDENKYEVAGKKLEELLTMADRGEINEAENFLLCNIDYRKKEEVAAAAYFYQYLCEKEEDFLLRNQYSLEEVIDGMKQLMRYAGYEDFIRILEE